MALDDPDPSAYHMTVAHLIKGTDTETLDTGALERSVTTLIAAHSTYRTAIREVDGELRQVILSPEEAPFELQMDVTHDRAPVPDSEALAVVNQITAELVARGFDLASGRTVWARLTKLAPQRHALVIVFHHIVMDFGSSHLFYRRLWELYAAARNGESISETAEFQFVDVADALARWALTPAGKAQAAAWRERVRDVPPVQVPVDLPRESTDSRRTAARAGIVADPMYPPERIVLSEDVREGITRLARKHRVSIMAVYLSGLYWLLHQATGQTDLCVESTIDMRTQNAAFGTVHGPLTSWTVLRADLADCKSFGEVVPIAGQTIAAVKKYGLIDDYYRVVPHTARRVVLNYVYARWGNRPGKDHQGIRMVRMGVPFARWKRPWDLHLTVLDDNVASFIWTGNQKLFHQETVHALLHRYLGILETETRPTQPTA